MISDPVNDRKLFVGTIDPDAAEMVVLPQAISPRPVPEGAALDHPSLYFNRELGDLDFNWRVLYQAMDARLPLLERVRFLAITASNLDEFFQKRVGGLKRQEAAGVPTLSPDGCSPTEQLELIREAARVMYRTMSELWETLRLALREAEIPVSDYEALSPEGQNAARAYFRSTVYPILTPLAVDPGRPFPFISSLSLSLAVTLRHEEHGTRHFVRLKVPVGRGRWLRVESHFVPIEQVIAHHVSELFPGMAVEGAYVFRVTRNADVRRDEEEAEDLLAVISEELRERRFAPVVRLEVERAMPPHVRHYLLQQLNLGEEDLFEMAGTLNLSHCAEIAECPRPDLSFAPWQPVVPQRLLPTDATGEREDIFAVLKEGDLLVHHPYELFDASVQRLVEAAAEDERVLAIKQTLYRTSDHSPIVAALVRAAERGKQVAVMVEVKARFDEANNIEWGQMLEDNGVHVAYGLVGLKTHTKVTLIVREEEGGIRTYCHIGTGNYNVRTARLYTDLGLLTSSPQLGADLINLFHYLTGYAPEQRYGKLIVAPRDMRRLFKELIQEEISHQHERGDGRIIVKMNALDDVELIKALYEASRAGVQTDLIIRGHCRLRPGLGGYSDNIRVISIIGRFLEHDRIFYFGNGGAPKTFIGSADWRRRNLSDRVEAVTPVEDAALQARLVQILEDALKDNRLAWDLDPDGRYLQRRPQPGEPERNFHVTLMRRATERSG